MHLSDQNKSGVSWEADQLRVRVIFPTFRQTPTIRYIVRYRFPCVRWKNRDPEILMINIDTAVSIVTNNVTIEMHL